MCHFPGKCAIFDPGKCAKGKWIIAHLTILDCVDTEKGAEKDMNTRIENTKMNAITKNAQKDTLNCGETT